MKKIIAMLLCVALVAAMGVSAFAAAGDSKTTVYSWEEWYAKKYAASDMSTVKGYAEALSAAKATYNDAKDSLEKLVKNAAKAFQTAQYAAAAAYIDEATFLYEVAVENAINEAWAEVIHDLQVQESTATTQPWSYFVGTFPPAAE